MNKSKKKLLIGILILLVGAAIYYLGIYKRTEESINSYNSGISEINAQIEDENAKNARLEDMASEIEAGKSSGSMVYDYDCSKEELNYLSQVVAGAISYDISFDEPFTEDGAYVRRNVTVSFTASNYKLARKIIDGIISSPYRTIFKNASFTPRPVNDTRLIDMSLSGNCEVEVSLDMTFIENMKGVENTKGINDLRPADTEAYDVE